MLFRSKSACAAQYSAQRRTQQDDVYNAQQKVQQLGNRNKRTKSLSALHQLASRQIMQTAQKCNQNDFPTTRPKARRAVRVILRSTPNGFAAIGELPSESSRIAPFFIGTTRRLSDYRDLRSFVVAHAAQPKKCFQKNAARQHLKP